MPLDRVINDQQNNEHLPRRWLAVLTVGLVLLASLFSFMRLPWLNEPAPAYQVMVQLVSNGRLDERAYDDRWFGALVMEATEGQFSDILSPTPPTLPLLILPLAWLHTDGRPPFLWAALNYVALLASICCMVAALRWPSASLPVAVVLSVTLLSAPLTANLHRGQVFIFLLLLHAVVFWGARQGQDRIAGVALGLLLVAKINGAPLWLLFLALRRWRLLMWAVLVAGGVVAATLLLFGPDIWRVYLTRTVPTYATSPIAAVPAYQTISGFFQHFLRYDAVWNRAPLFNLPPLATVATLASSAALLVTTLWRSERLPQAFTLAACVVLSVITSPLGEQYHFVLLVVPFSVAAASIHQFSLPLRVLLVGAAMLVSVPLPYMSERWWAGLYALLVYPRLYGALVLWGLLVFPELFGGAALRRDHPVHRVDT